MAIITEIGDLIRELRGKRSLREMERLSGVSHTYLSSIEKGVDPRSGKEIVPTPDVLQKLHQSLGKSYAELMVKAGHITRREYEDITWEDLLGYTTEAKVSILRDLKRALEEFSDGYYYNEHKLTNDDRQRILVMLKALFPKYAEKPPEGEEIK